MDENSTCSSEECVESLIVAREMIPTDLELCCKCRRNIEDINEQRDVN